VRKLAAMATIGVNGMEIGYDLAGEGPALVLVHGGASDARKWEPQLAALADEFTVLAWDEPGAGRSSDLPPGEFGLAGIADALAGLIDQLELAPAHVAGLSWGGVVALELYRRRPEVVGTLVLCDTYAGWKGSLEPVEVQARLAGLRSELEDPNGFEAKLPGLFSPDPPSDAVALMERIMADVRPESMRHTFEAIADADLSELLPRIDVPTLLIWGEEDLRSPPESVARQFHEAIPDSQLVLIEGAGHVSNLERPALFNRAVRDFCRAHRLG
jgi:pimeloyl-ACP methyl ester carboxylesterase